jgi:hypothetical protein
MMKANRRHNTAGSHWKATPIARQSAHASESAMITGTAAPESVFGRAAKIQALGESVRIVSMILEFFACKNTNILLFFRTTGEKNFHLSCLVYYLFTIFATINKKP